MAKFTEEFWSFVVEHGADDVAKLRLKYHGVTGEIDYDLAITQIECRRKFGKKLAKTLGKCKDFLFPDTLAGEQCTSDVLAEFHCSLISENEDVCDLTAGLGIDCLHVADKAKTVVAVERKPALVDALQTNAAGLGFANVKAVNGDSRELLADGKLNGDVAFIDPARRSQSGGRVYALCDCEPNVVDMLPTLSKHFKRLIVKMSPMLDVTQTLRELPGTTDVYALGTSGECKELVAVVDLHAADVEPRIHAVTVDKVGGLSDFEFTADEESSAALSQLGDVSVGDYVYEPLPAVMKAAPLRLFAERYGLRKFHNNTHVYFGGEPVENIQADVWVVERVIEWRSKNIKRVKSEYAKIDVAVRNFGMTADALRAKLGVKQGGDRRLLGVTDRNEKRLLLVLRKP
jgi:16S rRNA G966 N2-methylase RsmD